MSAASSNDRPLARGRSLQGYDLPRPDALVGGKDDPQAIHRIVHVGREIEVLPDGAEQILLLAVAEPLVIWFILGADQLVGAYEPVLRVDLGVVQAKAVRL